MIPYIRINQLHIDSIPDSSISLNVSKGDIVGITGRNGSGKSTFARFLAGEERPDKMGTILINGLDPYSQLDREKIRNISGLVYQNSRESVVLENVGREIAFGAENQGLPVEKTMKRTSFYLKKYSLWNKRNSSVYSLSASESQRMALSSILIMHPDILVLDEPFSMMSSREIHKYMDTVIKSARKRQQTVFVFSKKPDVLRMTDIHYEIADGMIREIDLDSAYIYDSFGKGFEEYTDTNEFDNAVGLSEGASGIKKRKNRKLTVQEYIQGNAEKVLRGLVYIM
jgi:energy-coupling factor transporter ATP-binding protein EcfA2